MKFIKVSDIEEYLNEVYEALDDMTGDDVYNSITDWIKYEAKVYEEGCDNEQK